MNQNFHEYINNKLNDVETEKINILIQYYPTGWWPFKKLVTDMFEIRVLRYINSKLRTDNVEVYSVMHGQVHTTDTMARQDAQRKLNDIVCHPGPGCKVDVVVETKQYRNERKIFKCDCDQS